MGEVRRVSTAYFAPPGSCALLQKHLRESVVQDCLREYWMREPKKQQAIEDGDYEEAARIRAEQTAQIERALRYCEELPR